MAATSLLHMMDQVTMTSHLVNASWKDVQEKAYRLLSEGKVEVEEISTYSVLCSVTGDNGTYEVYVNNAARVYKDNDIDKTNFFCTCQWGSLVNSGGRPHDGADSTGSVKVYDRFCSHAYAAYLVLNEYRKLNRK